MSSELLELDQLVKSVNDKIRIVDTWMIETCNEKLFSPKFSKVAGHDTHRPDRLGLGAKLEVGAQKAAQDSAFANYKMKSSFEGKLAGDNTKLKSKHNLKKCSDKSGGEQEEESRSSLLASVFLEKASRKAPNDTKSILELYKKNKKRKRH